MPPSPRPDPYPGHNFLVQLTGISDDPAPPSAGFTEVTGLKMQVEPIGYRNGNEGLTMRQVPGLAKPDRLTLTRGITADLPFWNWVRSTANGSVQRVNGAVILQDENQAEVMRWTFERAWCCSYTGPSLNAADNKIALEKLEIVVENLHVDGEAE